MKSRIAITMLALVLCTSTALVRAQNGAPLSKDPARATRDCFETANAANQKVELNLDMMRAKLVQAAKEHPKADQRAIEAFDQKAKSVRTENVKTLQLMKVRLESIGRAEGVTAKFNAACTSYIRDITQRGTAIERELAAKTALPPPTVK